MSRKKPEKNTSTDAVEDLVPDVEPVETEVVAAEEAPVIAEPSSNKAPVIYLGPTLPDGTLVRYTTFRDAKLLRPHVKQLVEQCKAVGEMIVPVEKLAEIERKLKDSASIESSRFATISKHFRKGV